MAAPLKALKNLHARAVVNHDSLNPGGAIGAAIDRWQPLLHIDDDCEPYTAVDTNGNVNGRLQDRGSKTDGCKDNTKGQTYARAAMHNAKLSSGATLYAAAASGHGDYKKTKNPQRSDNYVMAEYFTSFGKNHELQFKNSPGRTYWIYDWATMTPATRQGRITGPSGDPKKLWGSANVPFIDANLGNNLSKAWS